MTCVTVEMSRPREATSVATSTGTRPPLKASITPSRWPWVRSPCSARTFMPLSRSVRKSWSQRIFVRTKTIAWSGCSARSTSTSLAALSRVSTGELELLDGVDRQRRRLDLDDQRVVEVAVGERADRRRHRRREERRLAARRRRREDLLDVLEEAEVEHLVGLVEHDVAAAVQLQRAARDEVEHAADGADDDVAAAAQLRLLVADRRAAEDGDDVDRRASRRRRAAPG